MKRHRPLLVAFALAVGATMATSAPALAQGVTQCTATFHVLHDDRIGALRVSAGQYQLRTNELTCVKASHLFAEFLRDFGGALPRPWVTTVLGVGNGRFSRGAGSNQYFIAQRTGDATAPANPGPATNGGGSHGDLLCPGTFRVLNDDRVGGLSIRGGRYTITLLGGNLACPNAVSLFRRFLRSPSGRLTGGWQVLPAAGEFVNGSTHNGFRIKPAP